MEPTDRSIGSAVLIQWRRRPPLNWGQVFNRKVARHVAFATVLLVTVFLGEFLSLWNLVYQPTDSKNLTYQLWKLNLLPCDLDKATEAMIGDTKRDQLVLGKTKAQLRIRFGYLLTPADASSYLRTYGYGDPYVYGRDVLFIRRSPWMVVFQHDRAVDLVLIKGA